MCDYQSSWSDFPIIIDTANTDKLLLLVQPYQPFFWQVSNQNWLAILDKASSDAW
jgi:hypothetical protein